MTSLIERVRTRTLVMTSVERVAEDVLAVTLRAGGGEPLAPWTPGAHVDVTLPSGIVRQYSLCSDPADRHGYRIAVRLDRGGRGGSAELHAVAAVGGELTVSEPRNTFDLVEADSYLLIAGGIGITPLLAMARHLSRAGKVVRLVYVGRSRASMPFVDQVAMLVDTDVVETSVSGRPVLRDLIGSAAAHAVYACGPVGLLEDVVDACADLAPIAGVHTERFDAVAASGPAFTVELARSALELEVTEGATVLDTIRAAGVDIDSSCEQGICGTCETRVLSGEIDHRDDILTDDERARGETMLVCVSRCAGRRLVLDL